MIKKIAAFLAFLVLILCFLSNEGEAQGRKKNRRSLKKDFRQIKSTRIKAKKKKSRYRSRRSRRSGSRNRLYAPMVVAKRLPRDFRPKNFKRIVPQLADTNTFVPQRPLSMASEDTSAMLEEGEPSIVEVDEEVQIDSFWVKITGYYAVWDSRRVNPYNIDGSSFADTIQVILYDTTRGLNWAMPVNNTYITSRFGPRGYRFHYGTDLELDKGDSVLAAFDGIVRVCSYDGRGYGKYVVLRHYNGLETLYGHMSKLEVEAGTLVQAGDLLGLGGSTGRSSGPHLHFEVRYQGNPMNPEFMFEFNKKELISDVYWITPDKFQYVRRISSPRRVNYRKVHYHRIRAGDTLMGISRKYGVPVPYLCRINGISRNGILRAGKRVRIR